VFNTLSGASVLAANDPFGAAADLGLEKRCVPQTFNRQSVPLSGDGSRPARLAESRIIVGNECALGQLCAEVPRAWIADDFARIACARRL